MDRHNRKIELARNYGKKVQDEIAALADEKAAAVRDYAVELDVKKDAAKEVLNRLTVTEEDLSEKADAVTRIGERISAYDKSLEELVRMSGRVEENLNRLRDEASFVDQADKKVAEVKNQLADLEKDIGGLELRFERENAASLEKTSESLVASVRSTVSDLQIAAETVERQVEEHREAVDKIEEERKLQLARDVETINKTVREAVERAGVKSGKLEEQALTKLREDAVERVKHFHEAFEQRMHEFRDAAKANLTEVQELIKAYKGEQKDYQAEWKRDHDALDALALSQREQWNAQAEETENRLSRLAKELDVKTAEAEQKILSSAEGRLAEYKEAQERQWERFESMADEASKLDGQLRLAMEDAETRVSREFAVFADEQKAVREQTALAFAESAGALKAEMAAVNKELEELKSAAYDKVSEQLGVFEDKFFADLSRRGDEIDRRLDDWRAELDGKLDALSIKAQSDRDEMELSFREELREKLDRLSSETSAFEESIRAGMAETDRSLAGLRSELKADLEDTRIQAKNAMQAELGAYSLEINGQITKNQRELEDWQNKFSARLREAEDTIEDTRRRAHDLLDKTNDQVAQVKTEIEDARKLAVSNKAEIIADTERQVKELDESVKDADRRIRDFSTANRLFEKAEEHKQELERKIDDLKNELKGLDQRRAEAAAIEQQCVTVRRLGDEVNAKMNRFLAEEHRLGVMENSFNRLISTSQAVEEKLRVVTTSDDILQGMQVKLRKLDEIMKESDERFARLERKNEALDAATAGIDKNYQTMEETEQALRHFIEKMDKTGDELESFRPAIESLSAASEKAGEAAEKLKTLDGDLAGIERRIGEMQKAREWLARAETRFEELNKQAQDQVKLLEDILKEDGKTPKKQAGAPSIAKRENVVKLARQGWKADEIARATKLSRGEVDLILEMGLKD
jgi:DNA repair exonuclease SbcCD ATPase subunit